MIGLLSKLFGGNKSQKDVKLILPIVEQINVHFKQYQSLSNDELRNKTVEFKDRITNHLSDIDLEVDNLKSEAEALSAEDISGRENIFQQIDKLKKQRNEKIEEALKDIHAEAFAVVKETARRFSSNIELTATATELDRELSLKKSHVIKVWSLKDTTSMD